MDLKPCGDFWNYHSIGFCIAIALFPRLTLLFSGICGMVFAGPLFWLGWLIVPRITVAILATFFYFPSNPILCVFVWMWALGGEVTEKKVITHH